MRASLIRVWGFGSLVLLGSACNSIFDITSGTGTGMGGGGTGTTTATSTGTTGHGGDSGTGGSNEAGTGGSEAGTGGSNEAGTGGSNEAGTGGSEAGTGGSEAGTGETCADAGTASCSGAVLTTCDSTGHTQVTTCAAASLCDYLNQRCSDYGRLGVGDQRACAIEDDQSIWCWGGNYGSPTQGGGNLVLGDTHRMFPSPVKIDGVVGRQVSVAYDFQCVLHDDGTVGCWGNSDYGALGAPTTQEYATVDPVPNVTGAVEISVSGGPCACARLSNGDVDCWGTQGHGCLGTAGTQTGAAAPTQIQLPAPALGISAGDGYFVPLCASLATGSVYCWSYNLPPTEIPGITDAEDVVAGWNVVYIRTKTGLYWTTQVAPAADAGAPDGGPGPYTWMPAISYAGFSGVTQMSTGAGFCALQADGSVLCASADGGDPVPPSMVAVPAGKQAVEVRDGSGNNYGASIACLRTSGSTIKDNVYCWGDDYDGALGIGAPEYRTTKLDVPSFSTHAVTSLTPGGTSVGVVLDDGSAWYWGNSEAYQAANTAQPTPAVLLNLGKNNVALHSDDSTGWGYATKTGGASVALFEQGTAQPVQSRLQTYSSNNYVDARHAYIDFGLLPNGTVVAFSDNQGGTINANDCGIFGNGGTSMVTGPAAVPSVTATALAYQDYSDCGSHVCVITTTGTVQCWGANGDGQSGFPGTPPGPPPYGPVYAPTAVPISGAGAITSLAVGADFTCATDGPSGTGQVYCWGNNSYGQLGIDFTYTYATAFPAAVTGIDNSGGTSPAVGVTAFDQFACAWLEDGTVWCWGNNDFGQMGNGTFDVQPSPVQVTGISDAVSVSAGPDFACAVHTGGTVSCWGSSYWGQGGTGLHGDNYTTPMAVSLP